MAWHGMGAGEGLNKHSVLDSFIMAHVQLCLQKTKLLGNVTSVEVEGQAESWLSQWLSSLIRMLRSCLIIIIIIR